MWVYHCFQAALEQATIFLYLALSFILSVIAIIWLGIMSRLIYLEYNKFHRTITHLYIFLDALLRVLEELRACRKSAEIRRNTPSRNTPSKNARSYRNGTLCITENLIKQISEIYVKIKNKHARFTCRKGVPPFAVYSVSRSMSFGIDTPSHSVSAWWL